MRILILRNSLPDPIELTQMKHPKSFEAKYRATFNKQNSLFKSVLQEKLFVSSLNSSGKK
jgi:hypothetical protein